MTTYAHRHFIVVASADQDAANQLAVNLYNGDEAQRLTFSVPLGATENGSPTHYGCSSVFTEPQRAWMERELSKGTVPSVKFFRLNRSGKILDSNNTAAKTRAGGNFTFDDALTHLSLVRIKQATA